MHYVCNYCDKTYHSVQAVYKHQRHTHDIIRRQRIMYQCYLCQNEFSSKSKLKTHIRMGHESLSQHRHKRIICPSEGCNNIFLNNVALRIHLQNIHALCLEEEVHEFANADEFNKWKLQVEERYKCSYIQESGERIRKNGVVKYYVCHRSYFPRPIANAKKSKKSGSNKIGRACPSVMKTIASLSPTKKLKVVFYSTHVGHECEIGRLRIPSSDRKMIAEKLAEGVTFPKILSDIRNSALEMGAQGGSELKRVYLLEQKDLHNIKRDFNINNCTKFHENDANDGEVQQNDLVCNAVVIPNAECDPVVELCISNVYHCSDDIDIKSRCEMILGLNSKIMMDDASKLYVVKHLDEVISRMNEGKVQLTSKENVNTDSLESQLKFFSKANQRKQKILHLSSVEEDIIKGSFSSTSSEVLLVHEGFDHTYCSNTNI